MMLSSLSVLLFVGCLSPERFADAYSGAQCQLLADCEMLDIYDFSSVDECAETTTAESDVAECEDYDRKSAKECVSTVEQMNCEDLISQTRPAACDAVCADPA